MTARPEPVEGRARAPAAPPPGLARAVEEAFGRAAERMRGLPICNPALRVEVVGLRAWQGEWVSALVSPWTVSLLVLPGGGGALRRLGADERQRWSFPSGEYDFLGAEEPALGAYQTCSLLSPPWELGSHEDARAAALGAVEALFAVEAPSPQPSPPARAGGEGEGGRSLPGGERGVSRRGFLSGAWRGAR